MLYVSAQPGHPLLQALARDLKLPLLAGAEALGADDFLMIHDEHGLGLQPAGRVLPVRVDFARGSLHWRRLHGGGESLVRAVRGRSRDALRVVDATAGLGTDSFVLASHGFSVLALERHPVVAALLADGLARASTEEELVAISARIQLRQCDAAHALRNWGADERPDVVYLDPMFPESPKSAAVNKAMRAFHELVGADTDADALLPLALDLARKRVVVKRPQRAPCLAGRAPSHQLSGKAVRFDVYAVGAGR